MDRDLLLNGMDKELGLPASKQGQERDSGFSEKVIDQQVDKVRDDDQVKAGNIFDSKNPPSHKASGRRGKKKVKEKVILDLQNQ